MALETIRLTRDLEVSSVLVDIMERKAGVELAGVYCTADWATLTGIVSAACFIRGGLAGIALLVVFF